MKRRKLIRDAFTYNGGGVSKADELQTAVITNITEYPGTINDLYIFYTYSGTKKMSFTDGEEVVI